MSEYFQEPKSSGGRVKVEFDFYNYATKAGLKDATCVDTSKYAKKVDLASLRSNLDKLDINKLKNVPSNFSNLKTKVNKLDVDYLVPVSVNLIKLSDVVKNNVVKKDVYNAKIKNIEDKIPDITNLATNTTLNAKENEVKNEISSITNLATTSALSADYNTKTNEIENKITTDHDHDKYISTQEFTKLTGENITARLAKTKLVSKGDIANFVKKTDLNKNEQMNYQKKLKQYQKKD